MQEVEEGTAECRRQGECWAHTLSLAGLGHVSRGLLGLETDGPRKQAKGVQLTHGFPAHPTETDPPKRTPTSLDIQRPFSLTSWGRCNDPAAKRPGPLFAESPGRPANTWPETQSRVGRAPPAVSASAARWRQSSTGPAAASARGPTARSEAPQPRSAQGAETAVACVYGATREPSASVREKP